MLVGVYTIPVLITYLGLISSMLAAIFSIGGNYKIAIILFMLAAIFDLFDGMIARKLNKTEKEKLFGVQIDSIIDTCSFGIVPIIIGYSMGLKHNIDLLIFLIYLICATMRLAYFNYLALSSENVNNIGNQRKYYLGLPVTYSAIILPLIYVVSYMFFKEFNVVLLRSVYLIIAMLFILNVKIPKPVGVWYFIFPIITVLWSIITFIVL